MMKLQKRQLWFYFLALFAVGMLFSGCQKAAEKTSLPTQLFPAATLTPQPETTTLSTGWKSPASTAYPLPDEDASSTPEAYPFPPKAAVGVATASEEPYPAPQDEGVGATLTSTPLLMPSAAPPTVGPAPTERIPQPFNTQVTLQTGKVSIYHSWKGARAEALLQIIRSFQDYYPDVVFDLTYFPQEELLARYTRTAYAGAGPELLFGSSDWRAELSRQNLVEDLSPYISISFKEMFNPVAFATGQYQGAQVCLPYNLRGVLLYRNRKIIPEASASFAQLISLAQQATRGGNLGAYFEGGSYFSLGHFLGLGGQLLDDQGNPLFDRDQFQAALAWIDLLRAMKQAGALEINGDRDRGFFEEGKVGLIIEGSWNKDALAQAIGKENLIIDAWVSYQPGRLSGFVQSDCVYLNANVRELSTPDHQAALNFLGFFLTTPIQNRLAETGFIPVLIGAQPSDPLTRQAMLAFQGGVPYPVELDDATRQVYFSALDGAVTAVLNQGQEPRQALQIAFEAIQKRMSEIRSERQ